MRFSVTIGVAIGLIASTFYGGAMVTSYAKDQGAGIAALQVKQASLNQEYQHLQDEVMKLREAQSVSQADQRVTATQISHIQLDINRIASQMDRLTALYYGEAIPHGE